MTYQSNIKISIIVPIYNAEKCIDRCIESIYAQTFTDYEIILVNDGSTDNSLAICRAYAAKDERITVIDKENGGAGSARNAGIDIVKGKYIYFLDADDDISDKLLQTVYENAEKTEADLVVFTFTRKIIDSVSGNVLSEKVNPKENAIYNTKQEFINNFSRLYYSGILFGGPCNKMYNRQIILQNNIRFPDLKRGQDEIFNLYYYPFVKKCCVISDNLYIYNAYDEKSKHKKYKLSYFSTTTLIYLKTVANLLESFCLHDEYTQEKFQNSVVYSIENGIMLAWNPLDKLSRDNKINHIVSVLNEEYIKSIVLNITYIPNGYEKFWKLVLSGDACKIYKYVQTQNFIKKFKKTLRNILKFVKK